MDVYKEICKLDSHSICKEYAVNETVNKLGDCPAHTAARLGRADDLDKILTNYTDQELARKNRYVSTRKKYSVSFACSYCQR